MERKHYLYAGIAVLFLIPLLGLIQVDPNGLTISNFLLRGHWTYGNDDYEIELWQPIAWLVMFWPVVLSALLLRKAVKSKQGATE